MRLHVRISMDSRLHLERCCERNRDLSIVRLPPLVLESADLTPRLGKTHFLFQRILLQAWSKVPGGGNRRR
jgi:hypothetical protein